MRVEADSWETDGTLPVGKVVALVVGQLTELVKRHSCVIGHNEVLSWSDGTNGNLVRDQKELEVVRDDTLVNHRSWLRVKLAVKEESIINSLIDKDLSKLWLTSFSIDIRECLFDCWKLSVHDERGLGLSYTVSVEDNQLR